MDFLRNLQENFDLDKGLDGLDLGNLVSLEEFPDRNKSAGTGLNKVLVTATATGKARQAHVAWEELNFEACKQDWEALCSKVQATEGKRGGEKWQDRAKLAEYELVKLCNVLLSLPDPTPFLSSTASLSAKILEVEEANRQLTLAADAAAADSKEVSKLVEEHRALQAAHKELQERADRQATELSSVAGAQGEAQAAKEQAATATAEVTRLQGILKTLREEHESAQAQLFELSSKQEQSLGACQRELEAALEEVESVSQRCAELEMERDRLAQKLAARKQSTANLAAAGGTAGSEGDKEEGATLDTDVESDELSSRERRGLGGGMGHDEFWERQMKARAEQVAQLQAQLDKAGQQAQEAAARHEAQVHAVNLQLSSAQMTVKELESELADRPSAESHSELVARAAALQQLVDVQIESEGWKQEVVQHPLKVLGMAAETPTALHTLLQERNRALSSELATLKRQVSESSSELSKVSTALTASKKQAAEQQLLIKRLETDLAQVQTSAARAGSGLKGGDHTPSDGLSIQVSLPAAGTQAGDSALAGAVSVGSPELLEPTTPPTADGSSNTNLLDILVQQRDRFRQRVVQLEEEKGALAEELGSTKRQLDTARTDNVALYEKLRYMEQYNQKALAQGGAGRPGRPNIVKVDASGVTLADQQDQVKGARYQCGPLSLQFGGGARSSAGGAPSPVSGSSTAVRARGVRGRLGAGLCFPEDPPDEEAGPEARYTKAYEARVNPFTEFQQHEVDSRVRGLQLHDRAVLAGGKLLVSSRFGRAFLAVYALLLHVFIMVLLYYATSPQTRVEYVDAASLKKYQAAGAGGGVSSAAATAAQAGATAVTAAVRRLLRGSSPSG